LKSREIIDIGPLIKQLIDQCDDEAIQPGRYRRLAGTQG